MQLRKDYQDNIPALMALALFLYICFGLPAMYPQPFKTGGDAVVEVVIAPGMSARNAADDIAAAGVVDDPGKLVQWMVKLNIDRSLRPGLYKLSKAPVVNVALQLKNSEPMTESVKLIPGMRYWKIAEVLYGEGKTSQLDAELLKNENFPKEIVNKLPESARDRIAFLLPETYFIVPEVDKGAQVIKPAAALWWQRVGKTLPENISADELLKLATLASIVEGEAKVAEERPVLAGIFLSRIDKSMRLQSCATVIYSWETLGVKKSSLTYKDLEIDSPYNTYANNGLPPGPISMPSLDSWFGAASPEESEYLFFFATPRGSHIFSQTYEEHLRQQSDVSLQ